ncbi:unnamed protein product [Ceratitis capitata]|uniref:(Mediterranean fruit fly) hypothetical protein n=1 Tax=Ceratitis capitata TaxID=7213 RepID=A0A811U7D6_CERCA|nr:unnamed protein product [Ceratitis capitata]
MFRVRLLDKLFIFSLFITFIAAFGSPQAFHYYTSTKYTISKPWRGNKQTFKDYSSNNLDTFGTQPQYIFGAKPNFMGILKTNTGLPKRETHMPNTYSYNGNDNTAFSASHQAQRNPQPYQTFRDKTKNQIAATSEQKEGSFCRRSFDGRSGYCILAYQCLHVIKSYREHGTKIDVCTYRRNLPVICCPLSEKHVEAQSISAKKCKQYNDVIENVKIDLPRMFSGKTCVPSLPLIVGGQVANEAEYPHMAALGWTQPDGDIKWNCGGTLISEQYVLTAGHCITSGDKPPDIVRLGVTNLNEENSTNLQDINISIIILHPKYESFTYYHDIALAKLARKVNITAKVQPACLWQLPDINLPTLVATGWGRTEFRGPRSNALQKVQLNMINQDLCEKLYRKERRLPKGISDEQFCVGHLTGGKDTCQGDSGGPLHAELPEMKCVKFVVGVTSFGKFCAKPKAPGVYIKIYPYLEWIEGIAFKDD